MDEGTHILATLDGIQRTVSESSLRRNLKLRDEDGIVSIPDTELFENLTLMGYNISQNQKITFQKGQFSYQWKYLIHTIMQCLSPKSTGFNEFSSNIATALVFLATNGTYNFSKMIFDEEEIVKLNDKVKVLEDKEDVAVTQSRDDAPIKGRSINEGEAGAERISNDSEEVARGLTSMDAATVLARGIDVLTGSGFIPTAGPPATFWSTARIETTDEGTKIVATVDGKPRTISESSIRRNLNLNDEAGISSLPDAELFEN
nr:synaptobrevin, longin-like domain protein [Tanacetum cinerariifolium]